MNSSRSVAVSVLIALLVLSAGSTLFAKTINVGPTATYKSIQAAINAAVNGDVVIVAKGTYKENIDFKGKAITVRSTTPTSPAVVKTTIIDGNKKGSVVAFKSGETATSGLRGFTITNGSTTYGGGVYCESGSSPTLTNNTIRGNSAARGGGVFCDSSSPTLNNNTIDGNSATYFGGGVCCYKSSPTLTKNTISGNSATGSDATGGGVYCFQSSPVLTSNTISGNSGTGGGGVQCYNASSPTLTSNIISGNSAIGVLGWGGGVSCEASSPTLTNNTITGNSTGSYGGGVSCNNSSPALTDNIISGNSAVGGRGGGGGVYCNGSSPTLTGNTISGNSASGDSGMGYSNGGGVCCENLSSPALIRNLINGNSVTSFGGGVFCNRSSPTLTSNTIGGNSADREGGGVSCRTDCSPVMRNTIIAFSTRGGGLYVPSLGSNHPVITYCDLYGNAGGDYVDLPNQTGKDGNLSKNPLFAWAAKGDFHEKSKGGRWNGSAWVKDTVQSPCIDAGAPTYAFSNEPAPNGGRINMGAYGNTAYASKSAPKG
ncbi:MAG: right-handed parallel beta-helix repeat-containing protein, partial [Armatimonadota bacterium]